MSEPQPEDIEKARGHLTTVPWDRSSFEDRADTLARTIASTREDAQAKERSRCWDIARHFEKQDCPDGLLMKVIEKILSGESVADFTQTHLPLFNVNQNNKLG